MIRLNVFIQVSESNRAAVLEAAKELVASSLKDKGCIAYDVFESATRNDVLMICETWQDAESLFRDVGSQNTGIGFHEARKV